MKICVILGSPRINGNTAELLKPFVAEFREMGHETEYITLADKQILPCKGCYRCQNVMDLFGCPQSDDLSGIAESVISADIAVFATPIYAWYCTAPMKALLERFVYGMNKFYGNKKGSLWAGKGCALITSHGYGREYGAEPFELGMKRYCEHSGLKYLGMYSVRDEDDKASFQTAEAVSGAIAFAREIAKTKEQI